MWRIFHKILLVRQNTVMVLSNFMWSFAFSLLIHDIHSIDSSNKMVIFPKSLELQRVISQTQLVHCMELLKAFLFKSGCKVQPKTCAVGNLTIFGWWGVVITSVYVHTIYLQMARRSFSKPSNVPLLTLLHEGFCSKPATLNLQHPGPKPR